MSKKRIIGGLLIGLLGITACQPQQPTAVPMLEPTPTMEAAAAAPTSAPNSGEQRITLATTTSTQDSGLLDYLLPYFTEETGITVDVVAVGTGQALALGEFGGADVLLVHARAREDAFVAAGDGSARYDVMYNDFAIVGPASDPAGIRG